MLRACYDFLRTTPPFCFRGWGLPPGDEVEFAVNITRRWMGVHTNTRWRKDHFIGISTTRVSHVSTLVETMAHEMDHAVQLENGGWTPNAEHNQDFYRRARIICRYHGWDPKAF